MNIFKFGYFAALDGGWKGSGVGCSGYGLVDTPPSLRQASPSKMQTFPSRIPHALGICFFLLPDVINGPVGETGGMDATIWLLEVHTPLPFSSFSLFGFPFSYCLSVWLC